MSSTPPVMPVYRRSDIVMSRGEGCYLFDESGKRYLDFATGIAVNALGHGHPHVVAALKAQAEKLWLCGNMYRIPQQERLAERLTNASFADSVFFSSSGAEAVEAGIKMLRRYHFANGAPERNRIITFEGGFHGRTLAGISAGGNDHAREGFAPLVDGFDRVAFNDIDAVTRAITPRTAGVLIEAVQGEGGIRAANHDFLRTLRTLCDAHGLLLMMDEVQCGMGRTGALFAFEHANVTPDICTVAKGIGNGFPLAATLAVEKVAQVMTPGSHGSTYGSNPLAMSVGNAVLDVMLNPGFFAQVQKTGTLLKASLEGVARRFPSVIAEVRGVGLLLGLKMKVPNYAFADRLRVRGLLTAPAVGEGVIRILPPLIVETSQIEEAVELLMKTCEESI